MNINYTNESKIVMNGNYSIQYNDKNESDDGCARFSDKGDKELAAENFNNDNKSSENGDFSDIFGKFSNKLLSFLELAIYQVQILILIIVEK